MQLLSSIGRNDDARWEEAETYACECGEPATRYIAGGGQEPKCDRCIAHAMATEGIERRDIYDLPAHAAHEMSLREIEALALQPV